MKAVEMMMVARICSILMYLGLIFALSVVTFYQNFCCSYVRMVCHSLNLKHGGSRAKTGYQKYGIFISIKVT